MANILKLSLFVLILNLHGYNESHIRKVLDRSGLRSLCTFERHAGVAPAPISRPRRQNWGKNVRPKVCSSVVVDSKKVHAADLQTVT